jgi:hypothetical protein
MCSIASPCSQAMVKNWSLPPTETRLSHGLRISILQTGLNSSLLNNAHLPAESGFVRAAPGLPTLWVGPQFRRAQFASERF